MQTTFGKWLKISLINLSIVAFLGVMLRYKIAFSFPYIDQKNLLHGHSHFAFSGWVSQAIMTLLLYYLFKRGQESFLKRYSWILFSNLIASYGMLISFAIQGYGFYSILFSVITIFVSYIFTVFFWNDLNKLKLNQNSHLWFKASLLFNVISSLGPFSLAYMMANHLIDQKTYLVSVYYFLHFQYNGWFLFACMGLFISKMDEIIDEERKMKYIFWIFALSCVPSFFLSALWLPIHQGIYLLVVISAIMQLLAWIWFIKLLFNNISILKEKMSNPAKWLMSLAAIAMSIKLILQIGSTYPPLSQLTFGFRPIVIGYLHLIFLGIISLFLLGYIISEKLLARNRTVIIGILIFVSGVFINETLLMIQGVSAIYTESVSHINIFLFIAAIIMLIGTFLINFRQSHSEK
jgi:hypothetical protein